MVRVLARRPATSVARLVQRWGSAVSSALFDPACARFVIPEIDGVIGYRQAWGCALAIGDPVCHPRHAEALSDAFRDFCRARGWATLVAAASARFAERCLARGYGGVEVGDELILDPRRDPTAGPRGRELGKQVNRARKAGVTVTEYDPSLVADPDLERALESVAASWVGERRGPQLLLARARLFERPWGKRWFYARLGERIVGVLSMVRLDARDGWLFDHLVQTPDAPGGTTELLVYRALAQLRSEDCAFATFGPVPSPRLGDMAGLGALSGALARALYQTAGRVLHLEGRARYRLRFQIARQESAWLLFCPPHLGLREVVAVMRALNVSSKR